jgi:hypothetical protein
MLLATDPTLARRLVDALGALRVLPVAHVSAATSRMLVTRPLAVIVGQRPVASEEEMLRDVALGVGAELVFVDEQDGQTALIESVRAAIDLARRRREGPPR